MSWLKRCTALLSSRRVDQDLDEELRSHLEMREEDNVAEGMSEEEARLNALQRFGNPALIKEATRAERIFRWLETLGQDLRYALRVMRKQPGFSAMAIVIVAVGIGAGATIFSITETSLRRGLYAPISDRWVLMRAYFPERNQWAFSFSIPEYLEFRGEDRIFEKVAFIGGSGCTLMLHNAPELLECTRVTADAIPMTQIDPFLGRTISAEEDRPGGASVAVLSYALWQREFQGDRRVLGTTIKLDGESRTVIGVMPPRYDLWGADVWLPYQLHVADTKSDDRRARVVALIRKGVTKQHVNLGLQQLAQRMARDYSATRPEYRGMTFAVWNIHEAIVGGVKPALLVLLAAVGLLLLVASANLGSLLLSRATTRRREMAVRAALGARRLRIVRQMLVESLVLSFLGGSLGVLLAVWGVPLAVSLVPQLPNGGEASLTGGALAAALGIAFVMGILFGIAPAFYGARTSMTEAFKEGSGQAGFGSSSHRVRNSLVASEIALSLVILASATLMIRTYRQLTLLDIGYRTKDLLTMEVGLPDSRYPHPPDLTAFFRKLDDRLRALPGVQGAAIVTGHPVMDRINDAATQNFELEGGQGQKDTANANFRIVTPEYFQVAGTRLLSGRFFADEDDADHPNVAIVNRTMARLFWPKESPLGKRIRVGATTGQAIEAPGVDPWVTIVGVVEDAKQIRIIDAPVRQELFFPLLQRGALRTMTLVLHSSVNETALTGAIRHAIQGLDPELPIASVYPIQQLVSDSFGPKRLTTVLLVFFAISAVTLVVVGIYAVMAFAVVQRTREIGVRMALGARRANILTMMLRQGLHLGMIGLILGSAASLGATRVLRSLFVDIDPVDPLTLVIASIGLAAVVVLASYIPSLRATKVDPIIALRYE